MIAGIQFKVCGLGSPADAAWADQSGADYLGFIFHPASPRGITLGQYAAMVPRLPACRTVAVSVEPSVAELSAQRDAGFEFFQIHFRRDLPVAQLESWAQAMGPARLWLAPKLPPGTDLSPAWLPLAGAFLLDGYAADKFGGTGRTGDWGLFARHRSEQPGRTWILSGGLTAANIGPALRATGADFVDVNSGVESAPGVKDQAKIAAFAAALARARSETQS